MATLSTYLADKLIDHSNGVILYALPTVWCGLSTTTSTPTVPGAEAAYTGYTRVPLSGLMGVASSQSAVNTSTINFPTCTGGSSIVVGFYTWDASTGGNMLKFGSTSLIVSNGTIPTVPIGDFITTMA